MKRSGSTSVPRREVVALIPALDEAESLPSVLTDLTREGVNQVVVVDNGSTDGTAEVARLHGAHVIREEERGYGAACQAGIAWLERTRAPGEDPVVLFVDADQYLEGGVVEDLVAPIREGRADLVLGVRTGPEGSSGVGSLLFHARLGNRLILTLVALLFGCRFQDLGPLRAVPLRTLQRLEMDDRNWGWTLQMQLRAIRLGLQTEEVHVLHRSRESGDSKITGSLCTSVHVGLKMFWTLARERLGSKPG